MPYTKEFILFWVRQIRLIGHSIHFFRALNKSNKNYSIRAMFCDILNKNFCTRSRNSSKLLHFYYYFVSILSLKVEH